MTPPAEGTSSYLRLLRREPTQQRSIRRVEDILDATAELLRNNDIRSITVRNVADGAGVPTGTVYQFFLDLDAVFQSLALRFIESMPEIVSVALAVQGPWQVVIGSVVDEFAAMIRRQPAMRSLWLSGVLDAATLDAEREVDGAIAIRLRDEVRKRSGSDDGTDVQWQVLVVLLDSLLRHAFTIDPDGDDQVLAEAKNAGCAYAQRVVGRG
ncbi:MAG: TetR/AcrR family transcriptional regulator [Rhodococcus sp. (in: high G+C Gram-positive bacteria)]